eukprot:CAMPEP_0168482976 /NCGR_PEP_ID=MMETSP0228-20121227/65323_1 /TAXON_ID=133427 /ORGANISM="Protoceratium reticulatum, Strain CCCM 535 (=CCMP 1889)" /LENGTH=443 /DNA_ID=CAMNT_0008499429 /DNA_START=154 /DNA_END=1482 /DNA_ORIENTATION=-
MTMLPNRQAAGGSTYSFSSQPRPVIGARKKYRDPGEDLTAYRDVKETCITWDKRVHRGNTYGMHTQNTIREAMQETLPQGSPAKSRRPSRPKEPRVFDMPLPERERIPVDLTKHLVAKEEVIEVDTAEAQTDEFLPEPPAEMYQPQKTGIDACTQVEDGELFIFDYEVEPILDVIINKTLEQSLMEVEEEHELDELQKFKEEWYQRQEVTMREWQKQVEEEWARWRKKEKVMQIKREEKRREARVLLKIQAVNAAKQHLSHLVPNAVADLKEVAFPDMRGMAINQAFLPQLLGQVQGEIEAMNRARRHVDEAFMPAIQGCLDRQAEGFLRHRDRTRDIERRRLEEAQCRKGRIRIRVDLGGEKVVVGPIQVSSADDIEVTHEHVFQWLQENEPKLSEAWPHGIVLMVNSEPVKATVDIFEAKAGQITMVPKPKPPSPPASEAE